MQEAQKTEEFLPRSEPLHAEDQYIRKRMLVVPTECHDQMRISIGACLDLLAEPNDPQDRNAVVIYHLGEKIGYVAKKDTIAMATCIKLERRVYGIVIGVTETDGKKEVEFEAWISKNRKEDGRDPNGKQEL